MDLCGPSRQEGTGKENYFMLIIDDYSILGFLFSKEKLKHLRNFKYLRL
jgi:hypothetical protein